MFKEFKGLRKNSFFWGFFLLISAHLRNHKFSSLIFVPDYPERLVIYLHTYQDFREARRAIFEYIEGWYNRKRIHSAIGYMTPQQKEDEELKKAE